MSGSDSNRPLNAIQFSEKVSKQIAKSVEDWNEPLSEEELRGIAAANANAGGASVPAGPITQSSDNRGVALPQEIRQYYEIAPTNAYGFSAPPHGIFDDNITDPEAYRSVHTLVDLLLDPPTRFYNVKFKGVHNPLMVRLELEWCKKTVSDSHFVHNPELGRSVLRADSKLRTHGLAAGLPAGYYSWLCGGVERPSNFSDESTAFWMLRSQLQKTV